MKTEVELQYKDVSDELKELWDIELDLLQCFAKVCDKHHLKWFVDGGTLLGAVRHNGFIPWDDDIDIIMPYDDYCKLCELADEFSDPYFFQTWKTEDGWRPYMCRLRRSDTTGYTWREHFYPKEWNKGVFIDIFAMSYLPDNKVIAGLQLLSLKMIRLLHSGYEAKRDAVLAADNKLLDAVAKGVYTVFKFIGGDMYLKKLLDTYVQIGGWQKTPSRRCGPILFRPYSKELIWLTDWYSNTTMIDFMNISVPCPADYDNRLKCQYGDYMTPVQAPTNHGGLTLDLHHSYKDANNK